MSGKRKLLLVEMVIPSGNDPCFRKWLDLGMLVYTGGCERTESEYRYLLAGAGFRLTRNVPTQSPVSVIEQSVSSLVLRELLVEARMSETVPSIFDLSPSEKLQLVEDLWDDLAGTPEAIPVHDWQKQELARRKANLANTPASALSWDEVKRRVRRRYAR